MIDMKAGGMKSLIIPLCVFPKNLMNAQQHSDLTTLMRESNPHFAGFHGTVGFPDLYALTRSAMEAAYLPHQRDITYHSQLTALASLEKFDKERERLTHPTDAGEPRLVHNGGVGVVIEVGVLGEGGYAIPSYPTPGPVLYTNGAH